MPAASAVAAGLFTAMVLSDRDDPPRQGTSRPVNIVTLCPHSTQTMTSVHSPLASSSSRHWWASQRSQRGQLTGSSIDILDHPPVM
jgi:hypothetical protein